MKNHLVFLAFIFINAAAMSTGLTRTDVSDAIASLKICEGKPGGSVRQDCADNAFKAIWDPITVPNECARSSSNSLRFKVISIKKCIVWLNSVEIPEARTVDTASAESVSSNTQNSVGNEPLPEVILKEKEANIIDKKIAEFPQENQLFFNMDAHLLIWSLFGVSLLLFFIVIFNYIFLARKNIFNNKLIVELKHEIETKKTSIEELKQQLKNVEDKLVSNSSKTFSFDNKDVINTSEESVEFAQFKPKVDQITKIIPDSQKAIPKTEIQEVAPTVNDETLHNEILQAINSLANSRSNLTEANFIFKLVSVVSNPLIKSLITEKMESAHFFRSSGSPSPQGPELIAFGLKESLNYYVVPYPSAGRVGLFSRWFDNAGKNYEVNPVLAIKPAFGSIGSDGNLVLVAQGTLA